MSASEAWGDGFAHDRLWSAASVRDWSELADGECARFFPGLRARGGVCAPELVARVRARAGACAPADGAWLLSLVEGAASPSRPDVQPADGDGGARAFARFGFLTGAHPAYLWPAAECLPGLGATAAWLGELKRRGRAFMPLDVAEYLVDAIGDEGLRDPALSALPLAQGLWPALRRAARARVEGPAEPVRWRAEAVGWRRALRFAGLRA